MSRTRPIYRKRIATTGEKVRNVIIVIWIEELINLGLDYYDLIAYLDAYHIPAAVSPIHDKDTWDSQSVLDWCTLHIDPMTGDLDERYIDDAPYVGMPKKPHIHLLLKGPSQQDAFWWSEYMSGLIPDIKPTRWDKCFSVEGSVRYWAHMDSPDKFRYNEWDIVSIAGFDLSPLVKKSSQTNQEMAANTYELIHFYDCKYFYEVLDIAKDLGDAELVSYIQGTHALWRGYLTSKVQQSMDSYRLRKLKADTVIREMEASKARREYGEPLSQ